MENQEVVAMSTTPKKKERDGLNYKLELTTDPVTREGKNGKFVEAKAKTTIKGKEREITVRAFLNTKEGASDKSQKTLDALAGKKKGDKTNAFGRVVAWEDKEAKRAGKYYQVLAVDVKPPVKAKKVEGPTK